MKLRQIILGINFALYAAAIVISIREGYDIINGSILGITSMIIGTILGEKK